MPSEESYLYVIVDYQILASYSLGCKKKRTNIFYLSSFLFTQCSGELILHRLMYLESLETNSDSR